MSRALNMADAPSGSRRRGFTLIELALALFLLSLAFGTVFVPLREQLESRRIAETQVLLDKAREALLGYAAARGHLPCPADERSAGREAEGSDHVTGTCAAYHGYFPAAELGFAASDGYGYARDAWATPANRIRYAVSRDAVGSSDNARAFTRANGMRAAGIASLSDPALSLLHVCSSAQGVSAGTSCGSAQTLVSTTPAVIWSVGPNAATGGRGADEAQNPNPNGGSADRIFVARVRSELAGSEFDDIVAWIPMPILIARLIAAGQLP